MEKNEITTAGKLKIGDRFYKRTDRKKKALQMVEEGYNSKDHKTPKLFCCATDIIDNKYINDNLKRKQYQPILQNLGVVFLRNVNDPKN